MTKALGLSCIVWYIRSNLTPLLSVLLTSLGCAYRLMIPFESVRETAYSCNNCDVVLPITVQLAAIFQSQLTDDNVDDFSCEKLSTDPDFALAASL
jgi:hypothetical protein